MASHIGDGLCLVSPFTLFQRLWSHVFVVQWFSDWGAFTDANGAALVSLRTGRRSSVQKTIQWRGVALEEQDPSWNGPKWDLLWNETVPEESRCLEGTVESVPWFSVSDWSCVLVVEMRSPLISPWCFSFWIPVSIFKNIPVHVTDVTTVSQTLGFPWGGRVYRPVDSRQLCIPVCTSAHSDHDLISRATLMWWRCRAQESRMKEDWRYQNPTYYSSLQH